MAYGNYDGGVWINGQWYPNNKAPRDPRVAEAIANREPVNITVGGQSQDDSVVDSMNSIMQNPEMQNYVSNVLTGDLDFQRTLELQQRQFDYNALEAQKARDEYRDLSSTAYQRAVKDLKAAGLNPALAATAGLGASAYAVQGSGSSGSYSLGNQGSQILSSIFTNLTNMSVAELNAFSRIVSSIFGALGSVVSAGVRPGNTYYFNK